MSIVHATIASHPFQLSSDEVVRTMRGVAAEAIRTHYVVIDGRRYPPKQVVATVTRLDRSDFISTQARSVLERLGFTVGRLGTPPRDGSATAPPPSSADTRLAREADMLRPHIGDFVAVSSDWTEVIASGPDPHSVKRSLDAIGRRGAIFRVPVHPESDVGGFGW